MALDGLDQIAGSAVMQEKEPLSEAPKRCGAELVGACLSLADAVGQRRPHVVQGEIGKRRVLALV